MEGLNNMKHNENAFHLFLDIETTGTVVGSGIWEIGAIILDNDSLEHYDPRLTFEEAFDNDSGNKFHSFIKVSDNAVVDQKTIEWIKNTANVYDRYLEAQLGEISTSIPEALANLNQHIEEYMINNDVNPIEAKLYVYTWGNFDVPLLEFWYKRSNIKPLWNYSTCIDMRSVALFDQLQHVYSVLRRPDTSKHEALSDAFELLRTTVTMLV
jgi:3' exoribonuclease, RNase T-like